MDGATAQPQRANVFIVGAPKCGTTAWVEYLQTHHDIFFTEKEYCFFAGDLPNFRFVHSEADYAQLFAQSGTAKIVGEASAMYLFSSVAAQRIKDYNPDAKILIFLREQEDYLPSLHNQFLREFSEGTEDFETAWRMSGQRPAATIPATSLEPRTLDYVAMGRFNEQVERYLTAFPPEHVRIIRFRDWTADPRATYVEILEFLGVEDDGRSDFPPINPGMRYRSQNLARFLLYPPEVVRKLVRLARRIVGFRGSIPYQKTISLMSAPGYKKQISGELRDEIRRYYAEENRLLDETIAAVNARSRQSKVG